MQYIFMIGMIVSLFFSFFKINPKLYSAILISFYSYFAYIYDPPENFDLYRHFGNLELLRVYGEQSLVYVTAPLSRYYFWIISYLHNDHLLPFFTIICIYSISFYAIHKLCCRYGMSITYENKIIFFYFAIFEYALAISNIRYPLAVMLVLIIYSTELQKKSLLLSFLYIVPALLHPGTLGLIVIKFLAGLKKIKFFLCIICLGGGMVFFEKISSVLLSYSLSFFGNAILVFSVQELFVNYTSKDAFLVAPVMLIPDIMKSLFLIFMIAFSVRCKKDKDNLNKFSLIVLTFAYLSLITGVSNGNIFNRLSWVFPFLIATYLIRTISILEKNGDYYRIKCFVLFIYSSCSILWSVLWLKIYYIDFFPYIK